MKHKNAIVGSFFLALSWAAIDEFHQSFVFGREGKIIDIGIDGIGILLFLSILLVWRTYFKIDS